MYKNVDIVGELMEELGYPFSYYAPAWGCDADNDMVTGAYGTAGHLVLSRYPITEAETITLVEGTPYKSSADGGYTEGRSAAHVVLNVEGMLVDVYASHFDTTSWNAFQTAFASEEYAPVGQYWILCANNKKFASSAADLAAALGVSAPVDVDFNDGDYEVYVSNGTSILETEIHTEWKTITGSQYMGNSYSYSAELPRYVIQKGETDTDPNTLVVGTMGVARMNNWNESYVEHLAALVAEHVPDVLCLQSISQNATGPYGGYGDKDLVGMLQNLLGYQYVAYTPAWYCDSDYDLETGDGTHGNMILSRYPITYIETITVQEGAIGATPEGRSVGHVVVDVEGTEVDVYYTEFEGSKVDANLAAFAENYAPETDKVIIAGILRNSNVSKFETALNTELEIAVEAHDYENILISDNLALANSKVESGVGNMDSFIVTTVYLDGSGIPEYTLTVNNGSGSGKYQEGTTVTVTANSAGRTKVFTGWTVESGNVTIEDPTLEEITIVMPAEAVVLTANYTDKEVEREPTGETADLNVAVLPAFRFASKYTDNKESIHAALLDLGADVLIITQIDQNSANYNNCDVPGEIAAALIETYPYSYYVQAWQVGGGYNGHLILSKYEIQEYETIVTNPGTADNSSDEGRAIGRVMLDIQGTDVDVFFMQMGNQSEWDGDKGLAAAIMASNADVWIAAGNMKFANPEESGIESKLGGEDISCAFGLKTDGSYNWVNIIASNGVTFSNAVRDANVSERFGANADPLYTADVTIPLYQDKVREVTLTAAVLPASRFGAKFTANKDAIIAAVKSLNVDVLAITQIDESVTNPSWWNHTDVATQLAEGLKDVYPYSYFAPAWVTVEGEDGAFGHLILSKYEIQEYETIVLVEGTPYQTGYTEGRAAGRVLLDVSGVNVDVFFMHTASAANWDVLAPHIQESTADAWLAMGFMNYANIEESGIEAALNGEDINAAHGIKTADNSAYNFINIIGSSNVTFSDPVRETDTFSGLGTDPLYSATATVVC